SPEDRPLFRSSNGPDTDLCATPAQQSALQLLCHVVQYELLAKHDPQLACHLQNVQVLPETYCLRWLRLLLAREFPLDQTLRVWDAMFAVAYESTSPSSSLELLPYVCVAMLVYFSTTLRDCDNTGCLQLLMRPASTPLPAHTIIDSALLMYNPMKESNHEDMDVVCFVEGSLGIVLTNAKAPYDFRLAVKELSGQALQSGKVHVGDLIESINGVKMYKISTDEIKKHIALLPRPLYVSFLHVDDSIPADSDDPVAAVASSSATTPFLLPDDTPLPPFLDGEQCYAHMETSMHQPVFHAPSGSCASHFVAGRLFLTNYRCLFQGFVSGTLWEIPVLSIACIVSDAAPIDINPLSLESTATSSGRRHSHSHLHHRGDPQYTVVLQCKDTQKVKFAFRDGQEFARMHKCLSVLAFPASLTDAFCFHYRPHILPSDVVMPFDIRADYQRVGLLHPAGGPSRFRCIDHAYLLCESYPRYLMVPSGMSDIKLQVAASFRSSQRLPVACWQHPTNHAVIARSSQPLVGLKSARCAEDEQLVQLLCGGHATSGEVFPSGFRYVIMDARGQLAAAGNKAMGKGTESTANYRGAKLAHMNMENIHAIRNSFQSLTAAFDPLDTDQNSSFFQKIDSSGWLKHVRLVLKASWELAEYVHSGVSVLTHCSDGWDRTAQMVSLAELMLDPFYRTLEGFQVLIEKEWCSFGHQFGLRSGHARSDVSNEQRSPIFLLWLDCVHQVLRQFETEFEFAPTLLLFLADHVYSCKYGNFMFDCEKSRVDCFEKYPATNVWGDIESMRDTFVNPLFSPQRTVLAPSTVWKNIVYEHSVRMAGHSRANSNHSFGTWKYVQHLVDVDPCTFLLHVDVLLSRSIRRLRATDAYKRYLSAPFHTLVNMSVHKVILALTLIYLFVIVVFALLYLTVDNSCNLAIATFPQAFIFSVSVLFTIGFGSGGNDVFFNSCASAISIITLQLSEAHVRCYAVLHKSAHFPHQVHHLQSYPMRLQQPDDDLNGWLILALPTICVHRLDAWSPLNPPPLHPEPAHNPAAQALFPEPPQRAVDIETGTRENRYRPEKPPLFNTTLNNVLTPVTKDEIDRLLHFWSEINMEVVVVVEGVDAATSSTTQMRHSFKAHDIVFNEQFVNCVFLDQENGGAIIDFNLFDRTAPLDFASVPVARELV
ncbi:hypothetical protein DYB32_009259, partial [Aphanomyces invadans]